MTFKRISTACALMFLAVVMGVGFSFAPLTATALSDGRYVALGDSVAAGIGLGGGDAGCARTDQAYPYAVAANTGLSLEHLACSGAKADEGLYGPQTVAGQPVPAQINQAFAAGTPDLISITIGANDLRWADFINQCYALRCGTGFDDLRAQAYLLDLKWELYVTLAKIKAKSYGSVPPVLLTGYYQPFANLTCGDTSYATGISQAEANWIASQTAALNSVINEAVSWYGFAHYVPIDFSGHELCADEPWIQGLADPAPFHPTAAGQQAMAVAISQAAAQL